MKDIDLVGMTTQELRSLQKKLNRELDKRTNMERKALLRQFEKMAQERGLSLSELIDDKEGAPSATPAESKPRGRRPAAAKPAKAPLPPMYSNPSDSSQTWSGRGRRPQWAVDWMEAGRSLDELKIAS